MSKMVKVIFGTNTKRVSSVVEDSTTVRAFLETQGHSCNGTTIHQDGVPLVGDELDKTFNELGVTDKTWLSAIVKSDNASC